ncbi:MAG: ferredoxin [Candidatus Lokiarchaeota archaeon]|nr:ferredoxin [Candidatus Lokiarchaeota archaeon]
MLQRLMIQIDEKKCNGCGLCVPNCEEAALQIVDGKAKLVAEKYCDGLGACLGHCPQGALSLEEIETVPFDEKGAKEFAESSRRENMESPCIGGQALVHDREETEIVVEPSKNSQLRQWPIKLKLISPQHPALRQANLLIVADCAGLSYAGIHEDFLKGKTTIMICPKFEDYATNSSQLSLIMKANDIQDVTVLHMEVPCCKGLINMVRDAIFQTGKRIPIKIYEIGVKGNIRGISS